jgi:hypothetical protein
MKCIYCLGSCTKSGKANGSQRFKCKECGHTQLSNYRSGGPGDFTTHFPFGTTEETNLISIDDIRLIEHFDDSTLRR